MIDTVEIATPEGVVLVNKHCTNCRFFAHDLTRFMPNRNGCGKGLPKADWQRYNGHGGCPEIEIGVSPAQGLVPDWAAYVDPPLIEIDVEAEKAFNAKQPRIPAGQPGGGQWVNVGGQYNHRQWGKVTVDSVSGGQAQVSYRNQQGVPRTRQVQVSDLSALGGVSAQRPGPPSPAAPARPSPARSLSPEEQAVQSVIDSRRPALKRVEGVLKGLFPGKKVVTREKTLASAMRDANFQMKRDPNKVVDPAQLSDLVGARVVFDDNADLIAGAKQFQQAGNADVDWAWSRGVMGAPGKQMPPNEGYHAVHFKTKDDVEVQMMTRRQEYFTERTHNVFDNWQLRDPNGRVGDLKPEFLKYMTEMGAYYNRLDNGQLTGAPPTAPAIAVQEQMVLYTDPLLRKELVDMTDMKDSRLAKLLKKTQAPVDEVPTFKDAELQDLALGKEVPVGENDDHKAHLQRHLNDKGRLLGKALRGIGGAQNQDILANLEKHILAHRAAMKSNVIG